jgi:hypothetical protein
MRIWNKKRTNHYFLDFISINVQNNIPQQKYIAACVLVKSFYPLLFVDARDDFGN